MRDALIRDYYQQIKGSTNYVKEIIDNGCVDTKYKNYCAEFVSYSRITGIKTASKIFSSDSKNNDRKIILELVESLVGKQKMTEEYRLDIEAALTAIGLYLRTYPTIGGNNEL